MSFSVQVADIDLGDTPVENIFITDFMPMADGTFVKVYLLGYKYALDKEDNMQITNETIAKHLNIPMVDVLKAWEFWEDKGVVVTSREDDEINFDVEFVNLKQLYINNILKTTCGAEATSSEKKSSFSTPYAYTPEDIMESKNSKAVNDMFAEIREITNRHTIPNDAKRILEWLTNYNVSPDMVVRAFLEAKKNDALSSRGYVEAILRNWHDQGLTSVEDLDEYISQRDERFRFFKMIMQALGKTGLPLDKEKEFMNKWLDDWKIDIEVILMACAENARIQTPNFNYTDKILEAWHKLDIKYIDQLESHLNSEKAEFENFKLILKAIGYSGVVTDIQKKYMKKWLYDWEFDSSFVVTVIEEISKNKRPTIENTDKYLDRCVEKEIFDKDSLMEAIKNSSEEVKPKKTYSNKAPSPKTKFHNFKQGTEELSDSELEDIIRKNFEKKMKNKGYDV